MEVFIQPDAEESARLAARVVAGLVRRKPEAVLGLATGSTPLGMYREIIRLHQEEGLDLSRVTTFNLDEYVGLAPEHPSSYHSFMFKHFFDHVNIAHDHIHIPDGRVHDIPAHCADYEEGIRQAGGIDLQVLGIGTDGHIGFNEPSSSLSSRTRIKTLTPQTREDNAPFFPPGSEVPHHVITMGIGTIMDSRECILLAFGRRKAHAMSQIVEGPVTAMAPGSALQLHPIVKVFMDDEASAELIRADYYRFAYKNKPEWQKI